MLLNRIKQDQGEIVGKATVGHSNLRESTAEAYKTWENECLKDYDRRCEAEPPLPVVRELQVNHTCIEDTTPDLANSMHACRQGNDAICAFVMHLPLASGLEHFFLQHCCRRVSI